MPDEPHRDAAGQFASPPQIRSKYELQPLDSAILRAIKSNPHHYTAIVAAMADLKVPTPAFPVSMDSLGAFDYGLSAAIAYWPGETDFLLVGADLVRSGVATGIPADARLYRALYALLPFRVLSGI